MMSLTAAVTDAQRVTRQVEDRVDEAIEFSERERAVIGAELSDIACRLELCRLAVLDPEPDQAPRGG